MNTHAGLSPSGKAPDFDSGIFVGSNPASPANSLPNTIGTHMLKYISTFISNYIEVLLMALVASGAIAYVVCLLFKGGF